MVAYWALAQRVVGSNPVINKLLVLFLADAVLLFHILQRIAALNYVFLEQPLLYMIAWQLVILNTDNVATVLQVHASAMFILLTVRN
jgi:hypothetical protein